APKPRAGNWCTAPAPGSGTNASRWPWRRKRSGTCCRLSPRPLRAGISRRSSRFWRPRHSWSATEAARFPALACRCGAASASRSSTWPPACVFAAACAARSPWPRANGGCCASSTASWNRRNTWRPMARASPASTHSATPTSWRKWRKRWAANLARWPEPTFLRFFSPGRHKAARPFVLSVNPSQTFTRGDLMSHPRLNCTSIAPKTYRAMIGVNATLAESTLGPILSDLVQTRVSQINGCAFCLDMHARDLRKHGESWQRINSLSTWRETDLYSAREQAALNWAETMTRLADRHSDRDADFAALQAEFSEQ